MHLPLFLLRNIYSVYIIISYCWCFNELFQPHHLLAMICIVRLPCFVNVSPEAIASPPSISLMIWGVAPQQRQRRGGWQRKRHEETCLPGKLIVRLCDWPTEVRSKPLQNSPLRQVHLFNKSNTIWTAVDFCISQEQLHASPRQLVFKGFGTCHSVKMENDVSCWDSPDFNESLQPWKLSCERFFAATSIISQKLLKEKATKNLDSSWILTFGIRGPLPQQLPAEYAFTRDRSPFHPICSKIGSMKHKKDRSNRAQQTLKTKRPGVPQQCRIVVVNHCSSLSSCFLSKKTGDILQTSGLLVILHLWNAKRAQNLWEVSNHCNCKIAAGVLAVRLKDKVHLFLVRKASGWEPTTPETPSTAVG